MIPEAEFEKTEKFAKQAFEKQGKLYPMFIFMFGEERKVMLTKFNNDEEKEMAFIFLRKFVEKERPSGYFVMTEGWMNTSNKENEMGIRPSQSPNKKTVLIISYFGSDMHTQTKIYKVDNKDKTINFIELPIPKNTESHSRFNFYVEDASPTYDEIKEKYKDKIKINREENNG